MVYFEPASRRPLATWAGVAIPNVRQTSTGQRRGPATGSVTASAQRAIVIHMCMARWAGVAIPYMWQTSTGQRGGPATGSVTASAQPRAVIHMHMANTIIIRISPLAVVQLGVGAALGELHVLLADIAPIARKGARLLLHLVLVIPGDP